MRDFANRPRPQRRARLPALAWAFAATLLAAPQLGQAQDRERLICSQPVQPTCVRSEITYENQQRIDRCRRDVQRYSDQVDEYVACLADKIERQESVRDAVAAELERRANPEVDGE